jgi:hypothetical protein
MAFFAGGARVELPGIFMTSQIPRDRDLKLLFRSSCCSLLSQVSDDVISANLSLSAAPVGLRITVNGQANASIVTTGEPFTLAATAIAADGGPAFGFDGLVALRGPLSATDPAGQPVTLQSGPLMVRALDGVARFEQMRMRKLGWYDALVHAFPVGFFVPQLESASTKLRSVAGIGKTILVVRQPGGAMGGIKFTSQPEVQIVDKAGNNALPAQTTVITAVLQLASDSVAGLAAGRLLGTTTASCHQTTSLCSFLNLKVDKAGRYVLAFTSSTSSAADGVQTDGVLSDEFEVQTGPIATVIAVQTPELSTGGIQFAIQPVAAVTDAGGNWVYSASDQVCCFRCSLPHDLRKQRRQPFRLLTFSSWLDQVQIAACCDCGTQSASNCPLNGSLTMAATQGIAAFNRLSSIAKGNSIQLRFRLLPVPGANDMIRGSNCTILLNRKRLLGCHAALPPACRP